MCRTACRLRATVAAHLLQQIKSDSKLRGAQPDPSRVGGNCETPTRHTRVGTSTDSQHQLWLDNPPFSGMASQAFTTIVSGPGQKASARHRKARSSSGEANTASFTAASASGTCTISGSVAQQPSSVGEATGTQAQHGYHTGKRAPLVLENLEHSGFIKCVGSETIHSLCITHWKRETRAFSLAGQNTHLLGMRQGFQREDGDLPQQAPLRRASA